MKKENVVVICPPCGESVALATKEGQNWKKTLWPLLPRLTAVLPPQGREMNGGFTLIELLVVVLIIGILAAVAVPQYQKAVYKSRYATMKNLVRSIADAQEVYYLANNEYADDFDKLDVSIPASTTTHEYEEGEDADALGKRQRYYDWGSCFTSSGTIASVQCTNNQISMSYNIRLLHTRNTTMRGKHMCLARGRNDVTTIQNHMCKQETRIASPSNQSTIEGNQYNSWVYP